MASLDLPQEHAPKSRDFRNLLLEYVQEVNGHPERRARYEADVIRVERERGFDVSFIQPDPGYVLETKSMSILHSSVVANVAFVNLASSVFVDKPSCRRVSGAVNGDDDDDVDQDDEDDDGQVHWIVPHTFSPPREKDVVDAAAKGVVYDCVFNPDTLLLAASDPDFKEMIECIAMDGIEYNFDVKLDRTSVRLHKSKYKGSSIAAVIRRPLASDSSTSLDATIQTADSKSDVIEAECPEHVIKYRHHVDMLDFAHGVSDDHTNANNELVVEIKLPLVNASDEVHLDVQPNEVFLKSSTEATVHHRYSLELKLPCAVREDYGRAQFDSEKKILTLVLPTYLADSGQSTVRVSERRTLDETSEVGLVEDSSSILALQLGAVSINNDQEAMEDVDLSPTTSASMSISPKHVLLLPNFSCHQDEQEIVFVLKTEHVCPKSLKVDHFHEGMASHIRYCTIDEGGVVQSNYALFLRFPCPCRVDETATSVSVNQDSVVVIFRKSLTAKTNWKDYFYDTDGTHELMKGKIEVNSLQESLNALWNESKMVADNRTNLLPVTITEVNSDRIVMDVRLELAAGATPQETSLSDKPLEDIVNSPTESTTSRPVRLTRKFRSVSESSAVDTARSSTRRILRGILKYPGRIRTLSESSDDFNWSSQDYATMDSDILEEEDGSESGPAGSGGGNGLKKSVHFNNNITKTLFRSNSSILGQRKKKQRRQRKRAVEQQRRTSESECSEGESDQRSGGVAMELDKVKHRGGTLTTTRNNARRKQNKNTSVAPVKEQNLNLKNDNEMVTKSKSKATMDRLNGNDEKTNVGRSINNDNNNGGGGGGGHKHKPKGGSRKATKANQSRGGGQNKASSS